MCEEQSEAGSEEAKAVIWTDRKGTTVAMQKAGTPLQTKSPAVKRVRPLLAGEDGAAGERTRGCGSESAFTSNITFHDGTPRAAPDPD